ncbi:(-)-germacrene D synthase [Manihot esculenta]|uniref:Uncharacterized protein n=1 Tax=Manihot esculenta TaxID=3983 RepID=A0A2C9UEX8_MANES|nr:(-)-germacrene D synthase [Manihot esculenta]OAY28588.1 hypothetical protein MANES_15G078900v8 [Manihot esculenta]
MQIQISASAHPPNAKTADVKRRSAGYQPSIWGDHFLSNNYHSLQNTNDGMYEHHAKLKQEVRSVLMMNVDKLSHKIDLIDSIQRLGVSYHFETEIDEILKEISSESDDDINDLYAIALKFRLVRQQGYNMSSDVFNKFKDSQGNFKDALVNDHRGMLSLYEATHLRVHGEDILEEALAFTTAHLESMVTPGMPLAPQITHALKQPIRKGLPRLEARRYFSIYEGESSCNPVLLSFAKLDFNILQKQHQKELSDIAKWWKELDFANKLPFARDRIVEGYFWILGVYFEPEYSPARRILTKVIAMTSIMDDIYDVYGTPEELELFTAAVERWDISAIDQLPEYMKEYYKTFLNVYTEIEKNLFDQGRLYRFYYAKEAMKNQVRAYFMESIWFHQKHLPTTEEYMSIALTTSGYALLAVTSLVGMGDIVTKDSFDWLFTEPKMVIASEIIARLMDDIVSHEFEQKRGHSASSIECYMKQHSATKEEAVQEFKKWVASAWKDINEECLYPTSVPMHVLTRILNLSRVMDVVYKNEDGYTHAGVLKDFVSSLLVDPV